MKTIKKKKHTHMCGRYRVQEINELSKVRRKNATKILKEKINEMSEQTRN